MTQPQVLSETYVERSNEFYDLMREQYGDIAVAAESVRAVLSRGKQAFAEIVNLETNAIKLAAEWQLQNYRCEGSVGTEIYHYLSAAEETCKTVIRFKRLVEIWRELSSGDLSRENTARRMLQIIEPRIQTDL